MQLIEPELGLIFWLVLFACILSLWILALASILKSDFKDSTTKLIWILVVVFLPIIGSVLYFILGRNQRINIH